MIKVEKADLVSNNDPNPSPRRVKLRMLEDKLKHCNKQGKRLL